MRTTFSAKVTGDGLPTVGSLGDLLWRAAGDFEFAARHDDVVTVQTAGNVAAVGAVAERLVTRSQNTLRKWAGA